MLQRFAPSIENKVLVVCLYGKVLPLARNLPYGRTNNTNYSIKANPL